MLTGDAALRQAAASEQIDVKGTIWLIEEMVREGRITVEVARASLDRMRNNGRRLPWDLAEQKLDVLSKRQLVSGKPKNIGENNRKSHMAVDVTAADGVSFGLLTLLALPAGKLADWQRVSAICQNR